MGSKRGKSSGFDWQDVNQAVVNLAAVLGGSITLTMMPEMRNGSWDLVVTAIRVRPAENAQDQPPSVLASVSCRALRYTELESACLSALHNLDLACYAQNAYMPSNPKA